MTTSADGGRDSNSSLSPASLGADSAFAATIRARSRAVNLLTTSSSTLAVMERLSPSLWYIIRRLFPSAMLPAIRVLSLTRWRICFVSEASLTALSTISWQRWKSWSVSIWFTSREIWPVAVWIE